MGHACMLALRHLEKLALESSWRKEYLFIEVLPVLRSELEWAEIPAPGRSERAGKVTVADENQLAKAKSHDSPPVDSLEATDVEMQSAAQVLSARVLSRK